MNDINEPSSNPYTAPQGDLSEQPEVAKGELAGRGSRFAAVFIDGIFMSLLALGPLVWFAGGWGGYVTLATSHAMAKVGFVVFGLLVYLAVNGVFLARDGQSIGKKLLRIKIVRTDGSHADFGRIVLRRLGPTYLIQLIPFVGGLLSLVDVLFIFRDSHQCVHDQIADTIVIDAR